MKNKYFNCKNRNLILLILVFVSSVTFAQVGINTITPNAASMLDVTATNKGVLLPRVALTGSNDATTIATPVTSLLIFNTATVTGANAIVPGFYYYDTTTTKWVKLTTGDGSPLQYFAESKITAIPNASTPVHRFAAIGAETNIDITLSPKGNGAITANVADNGISGGNKRGNNAVDLQTFRDDKTQVASGNFSTVIGGNGNRAAGLNSIAGGVNSAAYGDNSIAFGNTNLANGVSSVALGIDGTATGNSAVAIGNNNTASGAYSTALGRHNSAKAAYETSIGVFGTTATPSSGTAWIAADKLFNIGNGTTDLLRSDAFTILKNGNTGLGDSSPTEKLVVQNGNISIDNNNNTAGTIKFLEPSTSGANFTTFKAGIQTANLNYTLPTVAPTANQVLSSSAAGVLSWSTAAGGALQFFDESRIITAPNATVPVHQFIPLSATNANIDIALTPKGTGAIVADIPNNSATGGNKRGASAVDLQIDRLTGSQVASEDYSVIIGGVNNTASGYNSTVLGGNGNIASGALSLAGGFNSKAQGFYSIAMGDTALAVEEHCIAIGSGTNAGSYYETAMGSYNTIVAGSATAWVPTNRLFNIGNGNPDLSTR